MGFCARGDYVRMSLLALVCAMVVLCAGVAHAIDTTPCADGTQYGKCSVNPPGFLCTGSPGSHALVQDTTHTICKCSDAPGYIESGTDCVAAKCGNVDTNTCDPNNKPKLCVNGALVDNATRCGCPSGKRIAANGLSCEFIPCNDSGISVLEGQCAVKSSGKKCSNGVLVDSASTCPCKSGLTKVGEKCMLLCSDGTQDGACSAAKPKKCVNGYLIDGADTCGCPEGKSAVGKQCTDSILGALGGADMLGGSSSGNQTGQAASGASPLSCCCLPTALIALAFGFVFVRKK